jgi:hypothetical protein
MADIDIVPKQRSSSAWIWIVIALVILAVLWYAFGRSGRAGGVGELVVPSGVVPAPSVAVVT